MNWENVKDVSRIIVGGIVFLIAAALEVGALILIVKLVKWAWGN